jgi:hypothetical protein
VSLQFGLLDASEGNVLSIGFTFRSLLNALEADLTEAADLLLEWVLVVRESFLFLGILARVAVLVLVGECVVLVGLDVLEEVVPLLLGKILSLGVGVVHGDVVIREVLVDGLHVQLGVALLLLVLVHQVDFPLESGCVVEGGGPAPAEPRVLLLC